MTRRVVGLTGGIGAGKTTAAAILADLGAVVVDCDQLGRDVAAIGGGAYAGIVSRFGSEIVAENGELDRAVLGAIVFNDPNALADLNAVTHPAIHAEIAAGIEAAPSDSVVVLDMAVLVESNLGKGLYDDVIVIEAPKTERLARLFDERNMSASDAEARMANQASDAERRAVAATVIVNDGDTDQLRAALRSWWHGQDFRPVDR